MDDQNIVPVAENSEQTNNAESVAENIEQSQTLSEQTQLADIDNTAIVEYLDIVKSEYETERDKKQSFENRAGLIMALLGAVYICYLYTMIMILKTIIVKQHYNFISCNTSLGTADHSLCFLGF